MLAQQGLLWTVVTVNHDNKNARTAILKCY